MITTKVEQLVAFFNQFERFTVAVSGGVDSMLLTYLAHRFSSATVTAMHAYSPAVPESALQRVKSHAQTYQWQLEIIDANEFNDSNYLSNPINRCYFCKSNLYTRIAEASSDVIFSGTNLDDLSDIRPGLQAAKELSVRHPYVEVGIVKQDIYAIAKHFALTNLYRLPAQPCLASRVQTGIHIKVDDMHFIDALEQHLSDILPSTDTIRCRITHTGVCVELDSVPIGQALEDLSNELNQYCAQRDKIFKGIKHYQKGSAFLNGIAHG